MASSSRPGMTSVPSGGRFAGISGVSRSRQEIERVRSTQALIIHMPADTTIGTDPTTVYTVPDKRFFLIEEMSINNTAAGTETFSVYLVPDGGAAGAANSVILGEQIATATSLRLVTMSGTPIRANFTLEIETSSAGGINVTFWGVVIAGI